MTLFWVGANMVLKVTMPLVQGLELLSDNDLPQVAYIYETLNQAKECIEENFMCEESSYKAF